MTVSIKEIMRDTMMKIERMNGTKIEIGNGISLEFKLDDLIEQIKENAPKIPCNCMKCYLLTF